MAETYKVKVIKADTGEVVKTLEAVTERAAERAERGLNLTSSPTLAFGHRLRGKEGDSYGATHEKPRA